MNREEIKHYLPHREPMLLVDEAEVDEQGVCHAQYRIREDEHFCRGHFEGNPIVPGVILCEIMAQSCALITKDELAGKTTLYAGINNMKFKHIVRPGDLCEITATVTNRRGPLTFCSAELRVDGNLCCKGELSFALIES